MNDIPEQGSGLRSVPLAELVAPKPEAYIPREVVFPSGADIVTMAHDGTDGHIVVTEYVLRDGLVMKAPEGDTGARLIFTILGAHELPGRSNGRKVYKTRIVGKSGTETPINHDVWVVADANGTTGKLFMTEPPDLVLSEPGKSERTNDAPNVERGKSRTANVSRTSSELPPILANKGSKLVTTPREQALHELLAEAEKANVVIRSDEEAQRLLDWAAKTEGVDPSSYHAVTIGDDIFVRPEHAGNVRVLREELIHVFQQRGGIGSHQIVEAEVQARLAMIAFRHRWGITRAEVIEMIVEVRKIRESGRY